MYNAPIPKKYNITIIPIKNHQLNIRNPVIIASFINKSH